MPQPEQAAGGHLVVLTPRQPLVAGGAAEDFEASVKRLLGQGCRLLIADLDAVATIDSAGIRALVRAHTSAGRIGGAFRIARPTANTRELLKLARLDAVLNVFDSVAEAKLRPFDWRKMLLLLARRPGVRGHRRHRTRLARRDARRQRCRQPVCRSGRRRTGRVGTAVGLSDLRAGAVVVGGGHRPVRHLRPEAAAARPATHPVDGTGAGAAVCLRRAHDDHHRQLAGAGVRHRRRGGHHPLPHPGR